MDDLAAQRMPADHYRRHASRVWRLAGDATTPAVKQHLRDLAANFERIAEGVAQEEAAYVAAYRREHRRALGASDAKDKALRC